MICEWCQALKQRQHRKQEFSSAQVEVCCFIMIVSGGQRHLGSPCSKQSSKGAGENLSLKIQNVKVKLTGITLKAGIKQRSTVIHERITEILENAGTFNECAEADWGVYEAWLYIYCIGRVISWWCSPPIKLTKHRNGEEVELKSNKTRWELSKQSRKGF